MITMTIKYIPAHDGKNMAMYYPMYGKPQPAKIVYQIFRDGDKIIGGVGSPSHGIQEFKKQLL